MAKKTLVAAGVAMSLGLSMVGNARADALAQAVLNVTNFQFTSGGTALDASAFSLLTITDTTTLTANLNGAPAVNPYTSFVFGPGGLPTQTNCAPGGSCASPFTLAPIPALSTGAIAGSFLNGAPVTGLTAGALPVAVPLGANATTAGLSQVLGTGAGNTQAGLTLNSSIQFKLNQSQSIALSFDASQILNAWANYPIFANATAGNTLSFTLGDSSGATIFSWAPNGTTGGISGGTVTSAGGCNLQATAAFAFPPGGLNTKSCSGTFAATESTLLQAGTLYTFGITQQSNTSVTSIPEPSSVALAGLALLGMGYVGVRRRKA